jgi:uncharacterized protein YjiS (DUF1127 family)
MSEMVMTLALSPAARFAAAWTQVLGSTVAVARALLNRRAVAPLLELNDRELRDLGLTRDDLRTALRQPLVRDPSVVLMVRAVDRRSLARAAAAPARRAPSVSEPAG